MSFDLKVKLLEMLNDRTLDGLSEVGMMIRNDTSFIADVVVDILQTILAEELIAGTERDLNDSP